MKRGTIIDLIERYQARHAVQEEHHGVDLHLLANGTSIASRPLKPTSNRTIFEAEAVRVWTIAVPPGAEWLPPHDHKHRLVVMLDKTGHLLAKDCDAISPGQWAWMPADGDCKIAHTADQTKHLMVVELSSMNDGSISREKQLERGNSNHEN